MKIRFWAKDDDVLIKDLYLENDLNNDESSDNTDIGERLSFKLYNEAGQLIQTQQMVNGSLHFETNNTSPIIVPQNGSSFVTIKGDIGDIMNESQTGKRLRLSLDGTHATKGIRAISASTGNDISIPQNGWEVSPGDVTGEEFVIYKTIISINHNPVQPEFLDPFLSLQEVYRFYIITSNHGGSDLGKVTLNLALTGMKSVNDAISSQDVEIRLVREDGTLDNTTYVGEVNVQNSTATTAEIYVDFNTQSLSAGERKVYTILLKNLENDSQGQADDDALVFSFKTDSVYSAPASKNNQSGNIVWSDRASPSHSNTSADWENGYLLPIEITAKVISD
jgi:hypothetical protein